MNHTRERRWIGWAWYLALVAGLFFAWRWNQRIHDRSDATDTREQRRRIAAELRPVAPSPGLSGDERNNIDVFRQVSPAVVAVANKALVRDWFGLQVYEVPQGAGSGFVWDRKGHIISNYHVVHRASALTVTFADGSACDAEIVGVDPDHDIAVLRVPATDRLTPVLLGSSGDLQVGQRVLAIGNPFGLDTSLSVGVVSALGRTITSLTERRIFDVIQTDAAINPGNSGGPLLDSAGRVIGINTAILSNDGSYAGIGFAVPVDTVRRIVPQLIAFGRVRRVGLGIQIVPDHIARRAVAHGVPVLRVFPDSVAANAGLEGVRRGWNNYVLGDVILAVDGEAVESNDDLTAVLDRHLAGDEVELRITRMDKERTVRVRLQHLE